MSVRQWIDFIRSVVSLLPLPTGMHVGLMRHGHRTFHRRTILAWYIAHSTEVAKRHCTAPDVHKASKTCSAVINAMIEHSDGRYSRIPP